MINTLEKVQQAGRSYYWDDQQFECQAASLDLDTTLQQAIRLTIPLLADTCSIHRFDAVSSESSRSGWSHRDGSIGTRICHLAKKSHAELCWPSKMPGSTLQ